MLAAAGGLRYARPIVGGLVILVAGVLPSIFLADLSAEFRPDIPWAALAVSAYLGLGVAGLHITRVVPMWPPQEADREAMPAWTIVGALIGLYVAWTLISLASPMPDLSAYPTSAYRWSQFLIGGVTAGVVEEVAFRGYMQPAVARIDRDSAVWITSIVFVLSHITQGPAAVLLMGPGLFAASMLYGTLARRTGSILPGMAIHVAGDLARVYFGVLHGDWSLLFVK